MTDPYATTDSLIDAPDTGAAEAPAKKPTLTEKQTAEVWRSIQAAETYQKDRFLSDYQDAKEILDGAQWDDLEEVTDSHRVTDNILTNAIRQRVRTLAYSRAEFTLVPMNRASQGKADIAKHVLKYYTRVPDKFGRTTRDELTQAIFDRELASFGVVMTGWYWCDEDTGKESESGRPEEGSGYTTQVPEVRNDRPFCKRVPPEDFLVPVQAKNNIQEMPHLIMREWVSLDAIKKNKRYAGTRDLKGTTKPVEDFLSTQDKKEQPDDCKYSELFHFYRKSDELHVVIARERPTKPLLIEKWSWELKEYPFVVMLSRQRPDEFYCEAIVTSCTSQQKRLNEGQSLLANHALQYNRQFQVKPGSMDQWAMSTLTGGEEGGVVETENPINLIPAPQLVPEIYKMMDEARRSLEQTLSLSQYTFHDAPSKRLTTTEAQIIAGAGGPMFAADSQDVEGLWEQVARHTLAWIFQFASHERELPIFGDDGFQVQDFMDFTGEAIRGEFLVEVNAGSTTPPDKQARIQDAGLVLQTLMEAFKLTAGQALPPAMSTAFIEVLRAQGVENPEKFFPAPEGPPPMPGLPPGPGGLPPGLPPSPGTPPAGLPGLDQIANMAPGEAQALLDQIHAQGPQQ